MSNAADFAERLAREMLAAEMAGDLLARLAASDVHEAPAKAREALAPKAAAVPAAAWTATFERNQDGTTAAVSLESDDPASTRWRITAERDAHGLMRAARIFPIQTSGVAA